MHSLHFLFLPFSIKFNAESANAFALLRMLHYNTTQQLPQPAGAPLSGVLYM